MARRPRAEVLEELRLFAEFHLVDVRRSRKGREIVAVKHAVFGWISPAEFYVMQEIHAALPKILEGGFRLKQAVWSTTYEVEILGTGVKAPVAIALVAGAIALAIIDRAAGRPDLALLDLAALILPYGEAYLIARGAIEASTLGSILEDRAGLAVKSHPIDIGKILWPF